jgi:hypothetical protein
MDLRDALDARALSSKPKAVIAATQVLRAQEIAELHPMRDGIAHAVIPA